MRRLHKRAIALSINADEGIKTIPIVSVYEVDEVTKLQNEADEAEKELQEALLEEKLARRELQDAEDALAEYN